MKYHTSEDAARIANTAIAQFGGGGALWLIGSKRPAYGEDANGRVYVLFGMMRNQSGANACRITLDEGRDVYMMSFMKVPRRLGWRATLTMTNEQIAERMKPKTLKEFDEVYCDQLASTFEDVTALVTRPPVVREIGTIRNGEVIR